MSTEALGGPGDPASFEVEGSPFAFGVQTCWEQTRAGSSPETPERRSKPSARDRSKMASTCLAMIGFKCGIQGRYVAGVLS